MPLIVTKRDGVFLLVATGMVTLFVLFAGGWGFPLDDSWIHQTYGRNLAHYGEWAFLRGQPSAASTSPLYTVLLALGYVLRVPYLLWTHLLGILALTGSAMLGARMSERIMPDSQWAGWAVGLSMLVTWHLIWAAAAGMETMLFGMLTLLLIHLAWRESILTQNHTHGALIRRGGMFGIVTALTALARPEGILLGGIAALLMLIVRPQGSLRGVIVYGIGAALGFAVMLSPYLWLNYQLVGGFLPNTASAKFQQHAVLLELPYLERYGNLLLSIAVGGQLLLLPGIVAYVWYRLRGTERIQGLYQLLPLIWALAHIALYASRLPAWYQHGRYVMPTLPALIFVGVMGTVALLQHTAQQGYRPPPVRVARLAVRVMALSAILTALAFIPIGMNAYKTDVAIINTEMVASAEYIRDHIPSDELMAIHDIGAVGYFAPREMIDIAGLVTPEIIPIVDDGDALWTYLENREARYLMAFPDQIPNDNPDDQRLCRIFYTDSPFTTQARGREGTSMAIYRLAFDATCER
ncbi:MAG: hypothetical protein ACFE0Q_07375 [Anaerolineae bacterium]